MIRLGLKLASASLMAVPLVIYRGHFEGLDRSFDARQHTYEARSLAERIGLDACGDRPVPAIRADIDAFAARTADNPRQVALAARMRAAVGDARALRSLAAEAAAEETRLLAPREAAGHADHAEVRRLGDAVFAMAMLLLLAWEVVDFFARRRRPPPVGRTPAEEDCEERLIEMSNQAGDLRLQVQAYEARYGRDATQQQIMEAIRHLQAGLDAPPEEGGAEHGGD